MLTRLAIVTAPALFVVLWSTGFIGARYGMPYIEPLTFLAVRMGFAAVIMATIVLLAGARRPNANRRVHRDQPGRTCRHLGTDPGAATDRDFGTRQPLHGREDYAAAIGRACAGASRSLACPTRPQ